MRIFLDVGNTRLKWALEDAQGGVAEAGSIDYKKDAWQNESHIDVSVAIDSAWASSVASADVRASIEQWIKKQFKRSVNWLSVTEQMCGVKNAYNDLAQLGVDRWAAVLGAKQYLQNSNCADRAAIVVDAGTAVTVDVLDASSVFSGGVILPGLSMMHDSLVGRTAGINSSLVGRGAVIGKNTQACVNAGVHCALYGAVERVVFEIKEELGVSQAVLLLTGGDAQLVAQNSKLPFTVLPNLVTDGLRYAVNLGEFK